MRLSVLLTASKISKVTLLLFILSFRGNSNPPHLRPSGVSQLHFSGKTPSKARFPLSVAVLSLSTDRGGIERFFGNSCRTIAEFRFPKRVF
jgi:hypothetical protein